MITRLFLTLIAAVAVSALPVRAVDTLLHSFGSGPSDGNTPLGSLTLSGGTLYGMTSAGGSNGKGTIFQISTDGTGYAVLHNFKLSSTDGTQPEFGALTLLGSRLYGTTVFGGAGPNGGIGTVFGMNTDGTGFQLLHSFSGTDGEAPPGTLTISGSTLFGTTSSGSGNAGTVFSLQTNGTAFQTLHSFSGTSPGGGYPVGSLVLSGSTLYGLSGGSGPTGYGSIYTMNVDGTGFNTFHVFSDGTADGGYPLGSLTLVGSKLYGMTNQGGANDDGTIFSIGTDGTGYSILHNFSGSGTDGGAPYGSFTFSGTKLFGMTEIGGSNGGGTIFSINLDGTGFNLINSFGGGSDGTRPQGDVTISGDGSTLYGMTSQGGNLAGGTVFTVPVVPEPAAWTSILVGTLALAGRRKRR